MVRQILHQIKVLSHSRKCNTFVQLLLGFLLIYGTKTLMNKSVWWTKALIQSQTLDTFACLVLFRKGIFLEINLRKGKWLFFAASLDPKKDKDFLECH